MFIWPGGNIHVYCIWKATHVRWANANFAKTFETLHSLTKNDNKINFPRVLWLNSLDPACYLSPLRIWSTHGSWLAPTSSKTHVIFSEYNSLTCNTIILPLCNVQCKNLWYELNPRVRCAFGNVLMLPKCWFDIRTLTSEFPRHQLERGILSEFFH